MNKDFKQLNSFKTKIDHISFCFNEAKLNGYILEFGVFKGSTINHIATLTNQDIYGFDSFIGLPEPWIMGNNKIENRFDLSGIKPTVPNHVKLIDGWFEDTIPPWKKEFKDQIKFLHVDSDLYSSCNTILYELNSQIVPGTIILFDELFGYPFWEKGEWKSLQEWTKDLGRKYQPLATARGWSGSIKILT